MHRSSLYLSAADDGAARICSRVWRAGYHAADHYGRDPLEPQHPWRRRLTYSKEQNLPGTEDWCNDQTLEKYVSSHVAQDCADGLNLLIRNYNAGVQITYKLYSEQEIAEDSSATMRSSITTRPARRMQSMRWCSPATSSTARQS